LYNERAGFLPDQFKPKQLFMLTKKLTMVLTFCLLALFSLTAMAQTPVSGTITSSRDGKPIAGASVVNQSTKAGTQTDANGKFTLPSKPGDRLLVTGVGFTQKEWPVVAGQSSLSISLDAADDNLESVVVVGYATQKKVNLTGSVASITAKDIEDRPITNLSSSLSGLLTGVSVSQGSGQPGSDGANIIVRGRGTLSGTAPLVIIDGVIGVLDAVNPQDVESISVLKDAASASIYGSQAGNGVILITTKKGTKNKLSVNYNGVFSFTNPMNVPLMVNDYAEHMRLTNEAHTNLNQAAKYSDLTIAAWDSASKIPNELSASGVPNYIAYPNTDWMKALFTSRLTQNHNISINGGSDKTSYLFSMGYLNNQGTIENTWSKRYMFRSNIESRITRFLTVGSQTFGQFQDDAMGNVSSAFTFVTQTVPGIVPRYDGRYGYAQISEENQQANNVFSFLNNTLGKDQTSRFNTTLFAKLDIIKGLTFESRFNYQMRQNESSSRSNPDAGIRWNFATNTQMTFQPNPANMSSTYRFDKNYQITLDNVLRYSTTLGQHHDISAFVGYNQLYYNYYNFAATKQGMIDFNLYVPSTVLNPTSTTGSESDWAIRSLFGRLNYAFKGKYLLETNLRYDGVSRFSPTSRFGYFPSASAGWRISDEKFMKNVKWINNLKLRASWGELGAYASGLYDWQATYANRLYSFNNVQVSGLAVGRYANPDLRWEATNIKDIGFDASLFRNKLNIEFDLFRRNTNGILSTIAIPLTAGIASAPTVNLASVQNQGFEFTLGTRGDIGAVRYSLSGNFAYTQNMVTKFRGKLEEGWTTDANGNKVYQSNLSAVYNSGALEGKMIGENYIYRVYRGNGSYTNADGTVNINGGPKDGMLRTQADLDWARAMLAAGYKLRPGNTIRKDAIWFGDLIYADLNGDGDYGNSYDREFTGTSSLPKYVFGFNVDLRWKQFDLSLIFAGAAGHRFSFNQRAFNSSSVVWGNAIAAKVAKERYYYNDADPSDPRNNINGKYVRLRVSDPQNAPVGSDWWLYDASWIKLRNLQLGYNLPANVAKRLSLQRARVFFTGENLFMITSFPGLDPEIGSGFSYPTMKQFAFGVNVTF
jgi:TonB-linked SusC/RagA family outer membrane protein